MGSLPTVALSIQQPWSWLIVNGHKDIENRSWPTRYRGEVLIHAGKKIDRECAADLWEGLHPAGTNRMLEAGAWRAYLAAGDARGQCGGIVGVAEIVDCVTRHDSPWFVGEYGFLIRNARPLPFTPLKGALGFFRAEYEPGAQRAAGDLFEAAS